MIGNLHIHTEFSLLQSYARIEKLAALAKEYHFKALSITDTNNTYGVIKFYQKSLEYGIKPIIGSLIEIEKKYVILLAKNNTGYYEINKLITCKNLLEKKFDFLSFLVKNIKNCFILSPFVDLMDNLKSLNLLCYLELPLTLPYDKQQKILRYSSEEKIAFIPTYPVNFLKKEDYTIFRLLTAIRRNKDIQSVEEECQLKKNNYFISRKKFEKVLEDYPGSKQRIEGIIQQCNVEFEFNKIELPQIKFSTKQYAFKKLAHLCVRKYNKKFEKWNLAYIKRLKKELLVIKKLNLESYFLIVYKIVQYAQKENISYTGRGSAANSFVCFLLDITFVDPLKYNLFFERFLHLKRNGLPDVDIDFPWNRRDKIIQFIYDTFKTTHTALISTHVTFNVRSAIRESAKVMGIDDREISHVTKKIPFFFRMENLLKLNEQLPELKGMNFKNSLWEKVLYYADRIMHLPRHISIHPGGMVISRKPLFYFTSLEKAPKGFYVTQLDMYDIEKLGLLKIDILGQRSLAVIDLVLKWIKPEIIPDMDVIFHDRKTIQIIKQGETIGCFYIESPAMRQLLKKLQVETFEELTAASSVIRPGVAESGMMQKYIQFHNNPSRAAYIHSDLGKILKETYGIMIYQEDVIRVASHIAGFHPEEGDILRKSMSGKSRSSKAIKSLKDKFISGCIANQYSSSVAVKLWSQIESFAGYAFCKAHSASYARVSFTVAYLKQYFPAEFMASVLSNRGGFYSPLVYVEEARRMKLTILPPDVMQADYNFIPCNTNSIITGLSFIKNFSYVTIKNILNERAKSGFLNLSDFIIRCHITETEFLLLAKCGALDFSGYNRKQLFFLASHLAGIKKKRYSSLFLNMEEKLHIPVKTDFSLKQKILFEIDLLGFSPTAHPLTLVKPKQGVIKSCEMKHYANQYVTMMGVRIFSKRIPSKKKNGFMKFISFMDLYGTFETFLSLKNYNRLIPLTLASSIFYVYGRVREDFEAYTLYLENIEPIMQR